MQPWYINQGACMLLKFGFYIIDRDKAFVLVKWAEEQGQPTPQKKKSWVCESEIRTEDLGFSVNGDVIHELSFESILQCRI